MVFPSYNLYRADRINRKQGGVAIYVHSSLLVGTHEKVSTSYCEASMVYIESINTIVIGVYKPPPNFSKPELSCPIEHFENLCSQILKFASKFPSSNIIIAGDFNLPFINWTDLNITTGGNVTSSERQCAEYLLRLREDLFLEQVVEEPTRRGKSDNILDLVFVNNDLLVQEVIVTGTSLSDHDLVTVKLRTSELPGIFEHGTRSQRPRTLNRKNRRDLFLAVDSTLAAGSRSVNTERYDISGICQGITTPATWFLIFMKPSSPGPVSFINNLFDSIDLMKADWDAIRRDLALFCWDEILSMEDQDMAWNEFITVVGEICAKHSPYRGPSAKKKKPAIPRDRTLLLRKKRTLNTRVAAIKSKHPEDLAKLNTLYEQLGEIELKMGESIRSQERGREKIAVTKMKTNPKAFHAFVNRKKPKSSRIGPLRDSEGNLTTDPERMANLLQDQYVKVFSSPSSDSLQNNPQSNARLQEITISAEAIGKAIADTPISSAPGPDKFPCLVLKECTAVLSPLLSQLWEKAFNSGQTAAIFKHQTIVPIYKKGNRGLASNYRPVSLTSHLCKLFERVVRKELVGFLEEQEVITQDQHGFRVGRSCLTQLVDHLDSVLKDLEAGHNVDVLYVDMAKAFDKVCHSRLLTKLASVGVGGNLLTWLESFLVGRTQSVVVEGKLSRPETVRSGVPQGTVLGPILFLLYVNDMPDVLQHSSMKLFADDAKLHKTIRDESDRSLLLDDIERVGEWAVKNSMELNADKYQLLQHGKNDLLKQPYKLPTGTTVCGDATVRDLGITVDTHLNWKEHTAQITKTANQVSGRVLRAFETRDEETMLTLLKTYIRPHLEYLSPIWSPHQVGEIQRVEAIQRAFTAKIENCQLLNYWQRLDYLNLYSLQRRRERYRILYMWKILRGIVPNHQNLVFRNSPRRGPYVERPLGKSGLKSINSTIFHSCTSTAAALFNATPKIVKEQLTLEAAKKELDNFLTNIPDNPPIKGYGKQNTNSILDWCLQRNY